MHATSWGGAAWQTQIVCSRGALVFIDGVSLIDRLESMRVWRCQMADPGCSLASMSGGVRGGVCQESVTYDNIAVADLMRECVRVQVFALKKVQGEEYKF